MNWTILSFGGGMSSLFFYLFAPLINLVELLKPIRLMAVSERDTSAAPTTPTISDNAPDDFARIVSVGIFKTSVDVSGWDANDDTAWDALETSGDLHIIGPVRGSLPEGSMTTGGGYGFLDMRKKYHSMDVPIVHANTAEAALAFWDTIADQPGDWSMMFVFEDLKAFIYLGKDLIPIPMTFNARAASESEEIGDERSTKVNAMFKHKRQPYQIDVSSAAANFKLN
ncbi:MAG: hypothetical protein RLN88_04350 [Ekhidna sp.]|uniref:hypothetical protein n=1 Tax=Ekhidna sp. TaxID=2608089 RepID=UPI0032ECDFB7